MLMGLDNLPDRLLTCNIYKLLKAFVEMNLYRIMILSSKLLAKWRIGFLLKNSQMRYLIHVLKELIMSNSFSIRIWKNSDKSISMVKELRSLFFSFAGPRCL